MTKTLVSLTLLAPACRNLAAPDLPKTASVAGVTVDAELTVVSPDPTEVRLVVTVTNPTADAVDLVFLAPPCSVLPKVYGHVVTRVIFFPHGASACAAVGRAMTVGPGQAMSMPDEPQFVVRDELGEAFRPGQYFISAIMQLGRLDGKVENIELGTRTINVR